MARRLFSLCIAAILSVILFVPFAVLVIWMHARRDLPVFYVSERMKTVDTPFRLYKFRTMRCPAAGEVNEGVSGGDKEGRITPLGRFMRRFRLDEIPQLLNILRGDMNIVGPRPPLRRYTETHRALYARVLECRPGVTGLASMAFHRHEERLLRKAGTPEETERVYVSRCIPRKATLDLIYRENAGLCLDLWIILQTFRKMAGR